MPDEISSSVDMAIARLDARPDWSLDCWSCGHHAEVPTDPSKREYHCDECGAVTAFGEPMPRFTIAPHVDRRFLVTKYESGKGAEKVEVDIVLSRDYATAYAIELLSVSDPGTYRALVAMMSRRRATGEAPAQAEADGLQLDAVP